MAKLLRLRRGTTTQHSTFTGAEGEVTIDTTKDTLVVHDNATAGGRPLLREDVSNLGTGAITSTHIADGTIVDADINASAAIAKTKISGTAITAADTGTVTSTLIADGTIVDGDINASAGIAHTKLAGITAGSVLMGNASAVPTATALTGDVTISSSGVTAISAGAVVTADIADGAVTSAKIADGAIVNGDINASAAIADTKLATISTAGKVSNSATTATNLNMSNAIVARDVSGNFNAGTITGSLNGSATGLSGVPNITVGTINSTSITATSAINANHGAAGAVTVGANGDIRFTNGAWTGEATGKIQHHNNTLYIQGGSGTACIVFRDDGGGDRASFDSDGHFLPGTGNTYDLGSSGARWRNIYTNDMNLSNEGGANDVDGTWGSWTIQEGEDDLFLLNRRNGKKYKFTLQEV
jgi:hypothetical protein